MSDTRFKSLINFESMLNVPFIREAFRAFMMQFLTPQGSITNQSLTIMKNNLHANIGANPDYQTFYNLINNDLANAGINNTNLCGIFWNLLNGAHNDFYANVVMSFLPRRY
jgi:hypothetical protein